MEDNNKENGDPEEALGDGLQTERKAERSAHDIIEEDGTSLPLPGGLVKYASDPDLRSNLRLDLSRCNVKLPILSTVCEYAALLNTPLTSLSLSWNALGPNGALLLGRALVTNNTLQILELESCELVGSPYRPQHDGIKSLAKGFESVRSTLRSINLADNSLQPEGCRILLGALSFHRSLSALDLSGNLLNAFNDKAGVLALSYTVQYARQLRALAINDNPLSSSAWKILQASLRANAALTSLHAERCELPAIDQVGSLPHVTDLHC